MTTNAGAADLARPAYGFTRSKREGDDTEAINKLFAPEFRNRLDATISFGHLPKEVVQKVVDKFVLQLEAQLADRNVTIELTDEARDWLVEHGYDEAMGARPMARLIQTTIKTPLADDVLFGRLKDGGAVRVIVKTDEIGLQSLGFEYPDGPREAEAREGRRATRRRRRARPKAQTYEAQESPRSRRAEVIRAAAVSAPFRRFRWFAHDDRRSRGAARSRPGHHAPRSKKTWREQRWERRRRRIWFEELWPGSWCR